VRCENGPRRLHIAIRTYYIKEVATADWFARFHIWTGLSAGNGGPMSFLSTLRDLVAVAGIIAAGYFFLLRREFFPRAQFDLSMRLMGERSNELLVELSARIKNVGLVRHSIDTFSFSLRGLDTDHQWEINTKKEDLVDFPRSIKRGNWVRKKYTTIVEPGVEQWFYFTVVVPANVEYLNLYSEIVYTRKWIEPHSAAIVKSVAELRKQYSSSTQPPQNAATAA
jgi:hypothetical protein